MGSYELSSGAPSLLSESSQAELSGPCVWCALSPLLKPLQPYGWIQSRGHLKGGKRSCSPSTLLSQIVIMLFCWMHTMALLTDRYIC